MSQQSTSTNENTWVQLELIHLIKKVDSLGNGITLGIRNVPTKTTERKTEATKTTVALAIDISFGFEKDREKFLTAILRKNWFSNLLDPDSYLNVRPVYFNTFPIPMDSFANWILFPIKESAEDPKKTESLTIRQIIEARKEQDEFNKMREDIKNQKVCAQSPTDTSLVLSIYHHDGTKIFSKCVDERGDYCCQNFVIETPQGEPYLRFLAILKRYIEEGRVKGVSDVEKAVSLVKEGYFDYATSLNYTNLFNRTIPDFQACVLLQEQIPSFTREQHVYETSMNIFLEERLLKEKSPKLKEKLRADLEKEIMEREKNSQIPETMLATLGFFGLSSALAYFSALFQERTLSNAESFAVYANYIGLDESQFNMLQSLGTSFGTSVGQTVFFQILKVSASNFLPPIIGTTSAITPAIVSILGSGFITSAFVSAAELTYGTVTDYMKYQTGKISSTEMMRNFSENTTSTLAGFGAGLGAGAIGGLAGAGVGTILGGPFIGAPVGALVGGFVVGVPASLAASLTTKKVHQEVNNVILGENDAKRMVKLLQTEFSAIALKHILSENDAKTIGDSFGRMKLNTPHSLRELHASPNRKKWILDRLEPMAIEISHQKGSNMRMPTIQQFQEHAQEFFAQRQASEGENNKFEF